MWLLPNLVRQALTQGVVMARSLRAERTLLTFLRSLERIALIQANGMVRLQVRPGEPVSHSHTHSVHTLTADMERLVVRRLERLSFHPSLKCLPLQFAHSFFLLLSVKPYERGSLTRTTYFCSWRRASTVML